MTDIIIQKKGLETILSQGKNKSELLKLSGKPITIKSTRHDNIIELEKSLKITGHDFIIDSQRRNSKLSIMGTLNINNSYLGELNINSEGKNTILVNNDEIKFNKFKFDQSLDKKSTPEFFGLELNNSRITNLGLAKNKRDAVSKEFMEDYVDDYVNNKFNEFNYKNKLDSIPEFFGINFKNGRISNLSNPIHKNDAVNKEFMEQYVEKKLNNTNIIESIISNNTNSIESIISNSKTKQSDKKLDAIVKIAAFNKIILSSKKIDFENADFINIKEPERGGTIITKKYFDKILKEDRQKLNLISKKGPINFISERSEFNFNSKKKSFFSINYRKKKVIFDNLNNNSIFIFQNNKTEILRIDKNYVLFNKRIIFPDESFINESNGDLELYSNNDIILNTIKNLQIHQDAIVRFGNDSFLYSKESKYFEINSKEDIQLNTDKDIYLNSKKLKISGILEANINIDSQKNITNLGLLKGLSLDTLQNVDMGGNVIQNIGEPIFDSDATSKKYVDTKIKEIEINSSAKVVEFNHLNSTYIESNNKLIDISTNKGPLIIDGYTLLANDRVVIAGQKDKDQNGIYIVTTVGSASSRWELTRAPDFSDLIEVNPNVLVSIERGTLHQDSLLAVRSDKIEGISGNNNSNNFIEFVKYSGLGASAVDNVLSLKQVLKTPEPIPNYSKLYIRDDGKVYILDSKGIETCLLGNKNNIDEDNEINIWNMMNDNTGISYPDLIFKGVVKEKFHIDDHISFTHLSQIPISEDNQTKLYVRDDGKLYFLDSKGIETCLINDTIDDDNEINIWNMTDDNFGTSYVDLIFKGTIKDKFHIDNHISFTYQTSTPIAEENQTKLFSKNDGKLYIIDQDGNESNLVKETGSNTGISGNLTIGSEGSESIFKVFGNGTGKYLLWDGSENKLTINDTLDVNGTSKTDIHAFKYQSDTPSVETDHLSVYSKNDGYLYSIDSSSREKKIKSMLTNDINPSTIEITITTNTNNSTYDLYKNTEYGIKIHKIIASTTTAVTGVSDMDIINSTTGNTIVDNTYFDPSIGNSSFYYQSNGTLTNDSVNVNNQISVKFDSNPGNSVNVKFIIYFVLT